MHSTKRLLSSSVHEHGHHDRHEEFTSLVPTERGTPACARLTAYARQHGDAERVRPPRGRGGRARDAGDELERDQGFYGAPAGPLRLVRVAAFS